MPPKTKIPSPESAAPATAGTEVIDPLSASPEAELSLGALGRFIKGRREKKIDKLDADADFYEGIGTAALTHLADVERVKDLTDSQEIGYERRKVLHKTKVAELDKPMTNEEAEAAEAADRLKSAGGSATTRRRFPINRRQRRQEKRVLANITGYERKWLKRTPLVKHFALERQDVPGTSELLPKTISTRRASVATPERHTVRTFATDGMKRKEIRHLKRLMKNGQISREQFEKEKAHIKHSHYLVTPAVRGHLHWERPRSKHAAKTERMFYSALDKANERAEKSVRKAEKFLDKAAKLQKKVDAMPEKAAKRKAKVKSAKSLAKKGINKLRRKES